jgi:hypothetical protein
VSGGAAGVYFDGRRRRFSTRWAVFETLQRAGAKKTELPLRGVLENSMASRPEKSRDVENSGGKSGWTLYRRGVIVLPAQ